MVSRKKKLLKIFSGVELSGSWFTSLSKLWLIGLYFQLNVFYFRRPVMDAKYLFPCFLVAFYVVFRSQSRRYEKCMMGIKSNNPVLDW